MRTLAIDVGGTGLKMICLDEQGAAVTERTRVLTPQPATVEAVLAALGGMDQPHEPYDRISVGFPGVVVDGVVKTAANLDPSWGDHDLAGSLRDLFGNRVGRQGMGGRGIGFGVADRLPASL